MDRLSVDRLSVDRREEDVMDLDYKTTIRRKEPRWKRIMKREGTDMLRLAAFSISLSFLIHIHIFLNSFFLFAISSTTSANLVVGLLHMLLVNICYVIFYQKELLWWLRKGFRPWYTVVCVGIFNLNYACATFLKKSSVWTYGELKHFEWTCVSPHTHCRIDPLIDGT